MKKLLLIFCLLAVFAACSEEEAKTEYIDPFLPVTDLQIPTRELTESEITLHGRGFEKDCKIRMQLQEGEIYETEIVAVVADSIVFRTPGIPDGFYIILLDQNGKTYRIGGINLVIEGLSPEDYDAYGVVGDENSEVYRVSLKKRQKGELLFKMTGEHTFYGGMVCDGMWYYATYRIEYDEYWQWKRFFRIMAYDLREETNETMIPDVEGFLAMGIIRGKMHIFRYAEDGLMHLMEWTGSTFRDVLTFPNIVAGKLTVIVDGIFLYDETRNAVVMAGQDMSGDTRKFVWTFTMDNPQIREIGGESSIFFHLVECDGKIYAFGEKMRGENNSDTYVLCLDNPTDWLFSEETPEAVFWDVGFSAPVYDKEKNVIYGSDDGTILTYDPKTKQLTGKKWIGSGIVSLVLY